MSIRHLQQRLKNSLCVSERFAPALIRTSGYTRRDSHGTHDSTQTSFSPSRAMTGQGRIVLVYRRAMCGAHPERVLAALDDRYREREVIDLALDTDGDGLAGIAHRLRLDDVLLVLADADWDTTCPDADGGLCIAVEPDDDQAALALTERTWEADIARLLDEVDLRIGVPSTSTYDVSLVEEDMDRLFDEAVRMQGIGRHQDAIGLFQTIVESRTLHLAGRAAYA